MNTWMYYGPFSLADADDAWAEFDLWLESEDSYDKVWWSISVDDNQYYGKSQSGSSGGWQHYVFDFRSVTQVNAIGASQVWLAFIFESDGFVEYEGAYVDNVVIKKRLAGCPLSCTASASTASGRVPLDVSFSSAVDTGGCPTAVTYDWDFGDGTAHSSAATPSHRYGVAGTYSWSLAVSGGGRSSRTGGRLEVTPPCSIACDATAPAYARLGTAAAFSVALSAANCAGTPTYEWTFGDTSPLDGSPSPQHVYSAGGSFNWGVTVRRDGAVCSDGGQIRTGNSWCQGPYDRIIPVAAHTGGLNSTTWKTDVDFLQVEGQEAHVDLALLLKDRANLTPSEAPISAPAARTLRLVDVLGTLLPGSNAALGIRFCDGRPLVDSRFYNTGTGDGATYGMLVPAVAEDAALTSGQTGFLHHLSYSPDATKGTRTNIGFANASAFSVEVEIRLFDAAGVLIGTKPHVLQPFEHRQFTNIHKTLNTPVVANGHATVVVKTNGGKVHPYAMVIQNKSGDPVYVAVERVTPSGS
jgi:hypothetical protein